MKRKKEGPAKPSFKAYKTFNLANKCQRDPLTNTSLPSEDDVKEARDWVNHNKK